MRKSNGHSSGRLLRREWIKPHLFWKKVRVGTPVECWEWTGNNDRKYGLSWVGKLGSATKAHRVSWALANGTLPGGALVRHTCDNPMCVNPLHLRLGTHNDNMADMASKGRSAVRACREMFRCPKCSKGRTKPGMCRRCGRLCEIVEERSPRDRALRRIELDSVVATVGPRNADILGRNFGLWGCPGPERLGEIGDFYGLSRERVRQIVVRSCEKLGVEPRTFFGW